MNILITLIFVANYIGEKANFLLSPSLFEQSSLRYDLNGRKEYNTFPERRKAFEAQFFPNPE